VTIIDHGPSTTVLGRTVARRFDGDSAALLRAVLEIHARPVGRSELFAELARRAGASPGELPAPPIDELIALLVGDGVLVEARPAPVMAPGGVRRVVLGISGAVAAVDAPELVRGLQAAGCEVRVALTRSGARMVSRAALEALTHHAVWTGLWQRDPRAPVPHVSLAEWAELVVVCPASATTVSRIATGDCSDLVAAIIAATRAPVVVVPSMNDAMYGSPAVQANLQTLRDHGRYVVHPALGLEVAHAPHARQAMLGPAPPAGAVVDIVRHLLRDAAPPRVPDGARGWERLWATTPAARLPWHADAPEAALAEALAARAAPGRRLIDLGTGDGLVAVAAAKLGYDVVALDIAPSALGRARDRAEVAGAHAIAFVLGDVTGPQPCGLGGAFDVAVDRGLIHCLSAEQRTGYAAAVAALVAPGGALLLVAHAPGVELGTHPVIADELRTLLPAFALQRTAPAVLAGAAAQLFELIRRS
jgi:3-polyprenyl-4-hydroxybenzoate decarboxylase/2-polyprenyl-3-methyl-5-hydroxy-6-metoxy-1,4-benzoquinol methylase